MRVFCEDEVFCGVLCENEVPVGSSVRMRSLWGPKKKSFVWSSVKKRSSVGSSVRNRSMWGSL